MSQLLSRVRCRESSNSVDNNEYLGNASSATHFRRSSNVPTEQSSSTSKLTMVEHVQTSAKVQEYLRRKPSSKSSLAKNPATLLQPPRIVGVSGLLQLGVKTKNEKGGRIN